MTSPNLSNPDSLEVLTATLNQALVETGRFFKSDGSLQARAQMKRNLPVAHEKFQSALDHLSEQIFVAKAFLERDYEDVKVRKAALRKRPTEDAAKGEPEVTTGAPQTMPVPEETAAEAVPSDGEPKAIDNAVKQEQQTDLNQEQQTTTNEPVKEEPKEADADPSLATQDTTGTEEINFDSLLNNQGPNEFDLNLDFGENGNAGNESFFNATFGDQDTGSGLDAGNTQMSNTEPGQDNNALPTGGDAFDLELEKFSTQPGDANGQFGGNTEDIMGPGESSFDDLFMETENLGGTDNENQDLLPGDGLMQLDELDDSWFS
ncbi:hypothetical protein ASPVEDRAFT_36731 [Aspergillus versicolor CBS 583.65]|uniref:Uncharacterized protein n=1 Tax=Aspergillus versicolor CBS 583.65 TaxID=1036611 RepID=A0A1L9P757_ASPVE|nr:uncharacterized protein ASPVEDRAFT_36731 [Aspergillus versicolor CBS 583.65]OJI97316.1 hypothetical protein ASPVEDRAFT_36731 [Aspergillus versicolor CBS 583.65]